MITPDFSVAQDLNNIILNLKIKFIKTSDIQIDIFQNEFKLYANPYFLRLNFPGNLMQDAKVEYDLSLGNLKVEIPKEIMEEFKDLEYTTKLLSKIKRSNEPLIQDISISDQIESEEIDWDIPQIQRSQDNILSKNYGFNYAYSGLETHLKNISIGLLNISEIDSPLSDFSLGLVRSQDEKFDSDYYYADFKEGIPTEIKEFKSEYSKSLYKFQKLQVLNDKVTEIDQQDLAKLVWKECIFFSLLKCRFTK